MKSNCFVLLILIFSTLLLNSCDPNGIYDKNKEIPNSIWPSNNIIPFEINIEDNSKKYNLYLNIRHAGAYQYRNLWIKVNTRFPSGKEFNQKVNLNLAEKDGKWLGSGMGDIWDNRILVQKEISFPETGTYTFQLNHFMRVDQLPFIMDVGIRVELVN